MNPVSLSSLVVLGLLFIVALVGGLVFGMRLARAGTQATVDAALANAGHAAQLELAQARERLRAGELAATAAHAELARLRDESDAARAEVLRVSASEAQKNQHVASLNERVADLERQAGEATALLDARSLALQTVHAELAHARTRADADRASAQEKLQLLTEARAALTDQFKTLATEILEEKSKRFAEQNQHNLGTLLDPLRTQLNEFKGKVEEVYVQEGKDRTALSEQVRQLMELNKTLSNDAHNLTQALKGSSKTQGNWGELILERVLEASGLRKGHEYHVQDSRLDDDGRRLQPDVVIHLPEDRRLVVDAKVSLVAYDRFMAAEADGDRTAAARTHLDSVRQHIRGLSAKRYQDLYGLKSLDLVVMFVPIEPAFMLAVTHDDALFMDAWQRNVLLVSPSTLLFVVRTIAHLWRQEAQSTNAQNIAKQATKLHDKLVAFVDDLQRVGAKLKEAQVAYDSAEKRLTYGREHVIGLAAGFSKLGVKTAKSLPEALVEAAGADDAAATPADPASMPLLDAVPPGTPAS